MNIDFTSLTSKQGSWRKSQSTLIYKTLYFSVLIVRSPCQATLGSCNPSGAVGTMPKPHTSCHKGIPGNEAAELAKAAATDTPPRPISLAPAKALIRRTITDPSSNRPRTAAVYEFILGNQTTSQPPTEQMLFS